MFLTHDYSINTAMVSLGQRIDRGDGELYLLNPISVGDDSFIGARASILGGTIGKNCIIGACAVVKGNIPDNSIAVGNPARIIGDTREYAKKHISLDDYFKE